MNHYLSLSELFFVLINHFAFLINNLIKLDVTLTHTAWGHIFNFVLNFFKNFNLLTNLFNCFK